MIEEIHKLLVVLFSCCHFLEPPDNSHFVDQSTLPYPQ